MEGGAEGLRGCCREKERLVPTVCQALWDVFFI